MMEIVPYAGWERNARIVAGNLQMIVTLDVGPRIIRFGQVGGPNEFVEYAKDLGRTGGDDYRSYGGHRLWIAPEERPKTYTPDNRPVEYARESDWHVFTPPVEGWLIQKELRIRAEESGFRIEHRLYNRGTQTVTLSPWSITVMAPGGECLWPTQVYGPQPDNLQPVRAAAIWSYTDLADPRWTWGSHVVRLRQMEVSAPQKIGMSVEQGIAGYANHGNLFYKRFGFEPGAAYPDFGCNFETFTRTGMLEIESLGPLVELVPGGMISHWETHHLLIGVTPPEHDAACRDFLDGLTR